jgi:RecB family exonuclease
MCWQERVAREVPEIPANWTCDSITDPTIATPDRMEGEIDPSVRIPGLTPDRPIATTSLRALLVCPHRFLLQHVLGWWEPDFPAVRHQLDPATYGKLFHRVAESFSREHGVAFGCRDRRIDHWLAIADELARREIAALLEVYPLVESGAREHEIDRIRRDVATWIAHDWNDGEPRRFVAAERSFGDGAVRIDTESGSLYVSGRIDRVDVERDVTIVRDLKTGRARPRDRDDTDPCPDLDLQLAVYARVVKQLAATWNVPSNAAAELVYIDPLAVDRERSFREDPERLTEAGNRWLDLAGRLLREARFVRTTRADDCNRCPFAPVCGPHAAAASRDRLETATGTLALYRELKS